MKTLITFFFALFAIQATAGEWVYTDQQPQYRQAAHRNYINRQTYQQAQAIIAAVQQTRYRMVQDPRTGYPIRVPVVYQEAPVYQRQPVQYVPQPAYVPPQRQPVYQDTLPAIHPQTVPVATQATDPEIDDMTDQQIEQATGPDGPVESAPRVAKAGSTKTWTIKESDGSSMTYTKSEQSGISDSARPVDGVDW